MADEIPLRMKDPNAVVDYDFNWAPGVAGRPDYLDVGETVSTSTWTFTEGDGAMVVLGSPAPSILGSGTRTKAFVSGGTPGAYYRLTNHITTSLGRADDRSVRLLCLDR